MYPKNKLPQTIIGLLSPIIIFIFVTSALGYEAIIVKEDRMRAMLERLESQADEKADAIYNYYETGRASYEKGDFLSAVDNFRRLLEIVPDYEPAKIYLKCSIIGRELSLQEEKINSLKLEMADIVAEYDGNIKTMEGLGMSYLLEQALLRCQAGDFDGAEHYYQLCYKLDPRNREKISWFVNSTYELKNLSDSLNTCYKKIEELFEVGDLNKIE